MGDLTARGRIAASVRAADWQAQAYVTTSLTGNRNTFAFGNPFSRARAPGDPAAAAPSALPYAGRSNSTDAMTDARAALLAAYLERRDDLLRFFTLRLRSAAAAEDLVQDIYVRIAAVDRDVEVRNAAAYLYRLGSNLMLDRIRGERRAAARDHDWREGHRTVHGGEEVAEETSADDAVAARRRRSWRCCANCRADPAGVPDAQVRRPEPRRVAQALGISQRGGEALHGGAEAWRGGCHDGAEAMQRHCVMCSRTGAIAPGLTR